MKRKSDVKSLLNKLSKNKFLTNKYVLYLVAFIAFLDILGYLLRQEFTAILFFYLVGVLVYCYNKNMTIVLGSALIVTSLVHLFKHMTSSVREGLDMDQDTKDNDVDGDGNLKNKTIEPLENEGKKEEKTEDADDDDDKEKTEDDDDADIEKYQNKLPLKPEHLNIPNKEQLAKQLGKADELETAYDNLEKVIGENGIKSMSTGTKELIQQQKELLNGLKEVTPALNEAMGAIGKIDLGNLTDMFNKTNIFNKDK